MNTTTALTFNASSGSSKKDNTPSADELGGLKLLQLDTRDMINFVLDFTTNQINY